jgi:hypothetical protein
LEGCRLLLVERGVDHLSVDRRELAELLEIDLRVLALLQQLPNELEDVAQTSLEHLLVDPSILRHGGIVWLDCGAHDDALLALQV